MPSPQAPASTLSWPPASAWTPPAPASPQRPRGRYFLLCCGDTQPPGGSARVHRVSQDKTCASFADGWHIGAIEPAATGITTDPDDIRAWLAALTRT